MLERAVAGGADALSLFTINGFNSLMILSDEFCRPFDGRRKGLNLGEGAGYVVLESEKSLMKSGKEPLAELTGYGNACDAFHQTASSADGQGACLAMTKALETAGLAPSDVDYINVHGTGTVNNDLSEGTAIARIFGKDVPPFSSTKAYTGHTLAAAGGIEAVFSVLALQHKVVFPNLHFGEPMPELRMQPVTQWGTGKQLKHVLSNSFGFGGNNSSLLFSKC
jgi:3-oxoacyl-[acyl-carrier-protein] synthase-1